MSRKIAAQRVDRLLLKRGVAPAERQQLRDGELILYYETTPQASRARAILVHDGVAVEQANYKLTVYLEATEERLRA